MRLSLRIFFLPFMILLLAACTENSQDEVSSKEITLLQLDQSKTGIGFSNIVQDTERLNVFMWNFIYQGAGVGIGDLNNDGLPDLYFCGNMSSDRLYLNKGNFQFKDLSEKAGILDQFWSTGVSFADINDDGLLDIYVCKNSPSSNAMGRGNKLYINKGDFEFEEMSQSYGLDDHGFSVHATFFDCDYDGDLDMYLVNQPVDQFASMLMDPASLVQLPRTDRLYVNLNGNYVDYTEATGLTNDFYGLNCIASDFDNDGRTDLYVSNDYFHPDQYLRNKDRYQFENVTPDHFGHTSFYSMGADAGDINNDGYQDLVVLDMSYEDHYKSKTNMESMRPDRFAEIVSMGYHHQYAYNMLQINNGEGKFSDIAQLAGIASTDWSWAPLLLDLDNDSYKDLIVSNGLINDLRNNDFTQYVKNYHSGVIDRSNYREVMAKLPSNKVKNKAFRNNGSYRFKDISQESGFDFEGFSTGMSYGDLDQDGDLDIVVNNTNALAGIYENVNGSNSNYIRIKLEGRPGNTFGIGAKVNVYYDGKISSSDMITSRGYMSSVEPVLHFGLGNAEQLDSVVVIWDHIWKSKVIDPPINKELEISFSNKIKYEQTRKAKMFVQDDKVLKYKHKEQAFDDYQAQVLLPHKLSQNGPFIAAHDINNDGRTDLFIGAAKDETGSLYLQTGNGQLFKADNSAFKLDARFEDMEAAFFDANSDGSPELLISSGSNEMGEPDLNHCTRLYYNDGKGSFKKAPGMDCISNINGQACLIEDLDGDEVDEIILGSRLTSGSYPTPGRSQILKRGREGYEDMTNSLAPDFQKEGMITDMVSDDFDNDGDIDFLVVGDWMEISVYENENGRFSVKRIPVFGHESNGWWWTVEKGDFDNDGDTDLLVGNLGENNKFHPSPEQAFSIYADDFDNDGFQDVVLAKNKSGKVLPVRGRECTSEELNFVAEKYPDYHSYAMASVDEIIEGAISDKLVQFSIKSFTSIYLENKGGLEFESHKLPIECQFGPIKDFLVKDINHDQNLDFVFAGNHYPVEVETVRYDASKGGICFGDGNGGFEFVPYERSGLYLDCDARDLEWIELGDNEFLIVSCNNDLVRFYKNNL